MHAGGGNGQPSHRGGGWIDDAVGRYERPLIGYAARLLNNDLDSARDVVQHVFLRLCAQDRSTVEPHLYEWLLTVCRNRAFDVRRKEGRMRLIDPATQSEVPEMGTAADPAVVAERQADGETVLSMLDSLPPSQAEVIRLKFQHGMSYEQIARVTKLSTGNVGFLLHTGIKTLRARLGVSINPQR